MIIPAEQWKPVVPDLRGSATSRSAALTNRVVAQFDVMNHPRYQSFVDPVTKRLKTFCATFCWDVSLAMGVEIPHWVPNPDQKMLVAVPRVEINANARNLWLKTEGPGRGWLPADEDAARDHAAGGYPAIASWWNQGGPGHEMWLMPPRTGATRATYGAQAGAHNFAYGLLTAGFGSKVPDFFINS